MTKTFNTDSERNAYFTHLSTVTDTPDTTKYVDGVLCQDDSPVTDKVFVARMEIMFDSLNKLVELDEGFLSRAKLVA